MPPPPPPGVPGALPIDTAVVCNNSELAFISDGNHELTISLTNGSYIPILAEVLGNPLGESDMLLAGVTASSWLHGRKNVSAQMGDPLLAQGWNLVVQSALRSMAPNSVWWSLIRKPKHFLTK